MVKTVDRLVLLQTLRTAPFSPPKCTRKLLRKRFVFPEFPQDRFMCKIRNVLRIVEVCGRGGPLVRLLPITRLAGIDTYEAGESIIWHYAHRTRKALITATMNVHTSRNKKQGRSFMTKPRGAPRSPLLNCGWSSSSTTVAFFCSPPYSGSQVVRHPEVE